MSATLSAVEVNETPQPAMRSAWDSFVMAKTGDEFFAAWLGLICADVQGVQVAAVLVEGVEDRTFVPVAAWPASAPEMSRLAGVIERALADRRGIVQPQPGSARMTHVAYPIMVSDRIGAVVALETSGSDSDVQVALRKIHWGSAWLSNMFDRREREAAIAGQQRLSGVLEAMAVALRHGTFQQALFELANTLRQHFACSRVAIGLVRHGTVRVAALSEAATFEKNTRIVKAYTAAMEEVLDQGKTAVVSTAKRSAVPVVSPVPAQAPAPAPAGQATAAVDPVPANPCHAALLVVSGDTDVVSVPLMHGIDCLGILTLEKSGPTGFEAEDLAWLDAFAAMLAPVVDQRRAAERSAASRLGAETRTLLSRFVGPRHLAWKAAALLVVLTVAVLLLVQIEYRVTAKTVIEGEVQRIAAAPFEGFIGASSVRAGDTLTQGQALATLDDRELKIEQARWSSERDQYDNRLREAMATHDMTAIQVIGAQLRQAQAQLALVTEKINRATLRAPYDGVVISGDLSQQIGAPVEAGKKLFEIAPLQSYRVILQVDEREIRHVQPGQTGRMLITGMAADPVALTVMKITPVATAQDAKNFFRVEARLDHPPARLRPGMEGVGKIEVGQRVLWWITTHAFAYWVRLSLWTWLP